MIMDWKITIEAWPHSTGKGADEDQKAAGDRVQVYYTRAESIHEAAGHAKLIVAGMESNPMVWQAVITGIVRVRK